MARSPLFRSLQRMISEAHAFNRSGIPFEDWSERRASLRQSLSEFEMSRRDFLRLSGAAAITGVIGCGGGGGDSEADARVAIVGAGIAGLHCAYRLQQAGVAADVYEGSSRVGGRMFSARGQFPQGQVAELGGEFIDSNHTTLLSLCAELGIAVDDLYSDEGPGTRRDSWFLFDRLVPDAEVIRSFAPVAQVMANTVALTDEDEDAFTATDQMSITQWLDSVAHADPVIRSLLVNAYRGEYGLECEEQSIFNLLYLIDYETIDPFRIYGESDERFHVRGGNSLVPEALANALERDVRTSFKLVAVRERADGLFVLVFDRDGTVIERTYEKVVFALPFTLLREVELSVPLSPEKQRVIDELGYGTNAKLMMGFSRRVWREDHNATGNSVTDDIVQATWESSRLQAGTNGIFTNFVGGERGISIGEGTAEDQASTVLPGIDKVFPGTAAAYISGTAVRMHWPSAPLHRGSYACYRPGQWSFAGIEGERAGNLHFCGEHCSLDFQGFMEGGCETGAAAAQEILVDFGLAAPEVERSWSRAGSRIRTRRGARGMKNRIGRAQPRR